MDIANLGFRVDPSGIRKGTAELGKMRKAGADVDKTFVKSEKSIARFGKIAGAAFTAVAALTVKGLSSFKDYGAAIAEVSTLLDDSWDSTAIETMSDSVRDLAVEFGGNASQNARGLYQVISAGASTSAEAIDTLTVANQLALGGVTDITTAADGLTTVMNAYGESAGTASDISDTFFTAMAFGKTTVGELSSNIGKAAPLAAQLGVSFDQTAIAAATLTKGGISTSEAMTGLSGILKAVLKPTEQAKSLASELGIEFNAAAVQSKGLAGFLDSLSIATGGSQEAMAQLFGDIEGLKAALSLTGPLAEDFADGLEKVAEKAGATKTAVEKITTGFGELSFQWDVAKSNVLDGFIELGEAAAPAATKILTSFNNAFTAIRDAFKDTEADSGKLAGNIDDAADSGLSFSSVIDSIKEGVAKVTSGFGDVEGNISGSTDEALELESVINRFLQGINKAVTATDEVTSNLKESAVAAGAALEATVNIDAFGGVGREIKIIKEELETIPSATTPAKNGVSELTDELIRQQSVIDQHERYVKRLNSSYSLIVDRLEPAEAATRRFRQEQQILWEKVEDGTIAYERYVELNDKLIESYEEAGDASNILSDSMETAKSVITRSFGDIIFEAKSLSDALSGIFEGIARSIVDKLGAIVVDNIFDKLFGSASSLPNIVDLLGFNAIKKAAPAAANIIKDVGAAIGLYSAQTTAAAGATAVFGSGVTGLGANLATTQTALIGLEGAATGLSAGAVGAGASLGVLGAESAIAAQAALEGAVALEAFGGAGALVGAEAVSAAPALSSLNLSFGAIGPYAIAGAAAIALLSGKLSGARSASEIMRDEVRELTSQIQSGTAETFNLAGGFEAAGSSAALMITGEDISRLQEFLDKIPGINTRLQEVDGTPVLRVLDSMERGVVELDNLIKGSTGSMSQSFADFTTNAQSGADKLAGTYVSASNSMLQAGENASDKIGISFEDAASITEGAAGRMDQALRDASSQAEANIDRFASTSVTNIGYTESAANDLTGAINSIPKNITITTRFNNIYSSSGNGNYDGPQGSNSAGAASFGVPVKNINEIQKKSVQTVEPTQAQSIENLKSGFKGLERQMRDMTAQMVEAINRGNTITLDSLEDQSIV